LLNVKLAAFTRVKDDIVMFLLTNVFIGTKKGVIMDKRFGYMIFNATFNISLISWRRILLVE